MIPAAWQGVEEVRLGHGHGAGGRVGRAYMEVTEFYTYDGPPLALDQHVGLLPFLVREPYSSSPMFPGFGSA